MESTNILGLQSFIELSTLDIQSEHSFWNRLGFEELSPGKDHFFISDGTVLLGLVETQPSPMKLVYRHEDQSAFESICQKMEVTASMKGEKLLIQSPDGFQLQVEYSKNSIPSLGNPQTTYSITPEQFKNGKNLPNPHCGVFGEVCHQVKDLETSLAFWKRLGFEPDNVDQEPYPWSIVLDGTSIIGLHQTDEFTYPAITYFAPDMEKRLEKIRYTDIRDAFKFVMDGESNAELTSPGGHKVFLFNL